MPFFGSRCGTLRANNVLIILAIALTVTARAQEVAIAVIIHRQSLDKGIQECGVPVQCPALVVGGHGDEFPRIL